MLCANLPKDWEAATASAPASDYLACLESKTILLPEEFVVRTLYITRAALLLCLSSFRARLDRDGGCNKEARHMS
jgi:hypothetical protein